MEINDSYQALAAAILIQALKDRRYPKLRKEVDEFFQSAWFEVVSDLAGVNPDVFRNRVLFHEPEELESQEA